LLAHFLAAPPREETLVAAARLQADSRTSLGRAIMGLAEAASKSSPRAAEEEFHRLFVGLGGGEFSPYASQYRAGALHTWPLLHLREDLAAAGVKRQKTWTEPEDHAASLLETMADAIEGRLPHLRAPSRMIFARHVAPWMPQFAADLARVEGAPLYASLGTVMEAFLTDESRIGQATQDASVSDPGRAV
jgi:TorA maturation chaperone TorD